MEFDVALFGDEIAAKLTAIGDDLKFLSHVAEHASQGSFDMSFARLDAVKEMAEAVSSVRMTALAGLSKVTAALEAHRTYEAMRKREAERASRERRLRRAHLFVIQAAIEDWLAEDENIIITADFSGSDRDVDNIMEQIDFKLRAQGRTEPLYIASLKQGYRKQWQDVDRIEIHASSTSRSKSCNPFIMPSWPDASEKDAARWRARFARAIQLASDLDLDRDPDGFSTFRLLHWREGEDE